MKLESTNFNQEKSIDLVFVALNLNMHKYCTALVFIICTYSIYGKINRITFFHDPPTDS